MTTALAPHSPIRTAKQRVVGIDVARGLAVIGMIAVHVLDTVNDDGSTSLTGILFAGRSATGFAMIAGISLAFISGRRVPPTGRARAGVAVGIAVRGVLIGVIGLLLAYLGAAQVILASYGVIFLLIIPLIGLRPRVLAGIAATIGVLGPILLVFLAEQGMAFPEEPLDPTLTTFVQSPGEALTLVVLTGTYPVAVYFAYMTAGLAIGRLDLSARRVQWALFVGGVAMAVSTRIIAWVILSPLGGLSQLVTAKQGTLIDSGEVPDSAAIVGRDLLGDTTTIDSWWYLATPASHSHSIADVGYSLGTAIGVLGLFLLLTRLAVVARMLGPLADLGSMPLTLYSAHLVIIATGVLEDWPGLLFTLMILSFFAFAVFWRRHQRQGPLEGLLAKASGRARDAVLSQTRP